VFTEFRLALSFLTLLPVSPSKKVNEDRIGRTIKYFTLVGLVFGLVNLFCLYLHQFHESKLITALLICLSNIFMSGGLHLDGLMDSFDGIAASKKTREETLAVMKDSRVGAFGAMAGTIIIISKIILISEIQFEKDWIYYGFVFFLLPLVSRLVMVMVILFQVNLDELKKEKSSLLIFKKSQKTWTYFLANLLSLKISAWVFVLAFPIEWSKLIKLDLCLLPCMFLSWFVYLWLKFKLKGHNGDSMGAGLELTELLLFLFIFFCLGV
jgi:adenosylcobinamide-GDP ribazoletransferase